MDSLTFRITGTKPLLMNNPQTVDPFNSYAIAKKRITSKRVKSDEDLILLRRLDVLSKLYYDPRIGIWIPDTWIVASMAANSWTKIKVKKAEIRSGVFPVEPKIPLQYNGDEHIEKKEDIIDHKIPDLDFIETLLLKQGQVKIAKAFPIFHDWHFESRLEFDKEIIDRTALISLLDYCASYSGFGDFRPSYGRAKFQVLD